MFTNSDYRNEPDPFPHTQAQSWGALVRGSGFAVVSEEGMRQTENYAPIRAALLEVDFLDHWDVDWLYNTGPRTADAKQSLVNQLSPSIINSIKQDP